MMIRCRAFLENLDDFYCRVLPRECSHSSVIFGLSSIELLITYRAVVKKAPCCGATQGSMFAFIVGFAAGSFIGIGYVLAVAAKSVPQCLADRNASWSCSVRHLV
jgi:hypothetical protein